MAEIPPHLQINPLAGVPMYLQGFGQGAQIGESRRRAEQVAYEQELQQQAQQERNEILREARQIQAQEFAQNLKLKQDEAARSARQAALQQEGRLGFERSMQEKIAQGMTPQEAAAQSLPLHASKLFAGHEQSLASMLSAMRERQQYGAPTVTEAGGRQFWQIPGSATGGLLPQAAEGGVQRIPFLDDEGNVVGYGRPGPGGTVIPLPAEKEKKPHRLQTELDKARADLAALQASTDAWSKREIPAQQARVNYLEQAVKGGKPAETKQEKQLTIEVAKDFLKQAGGDKAKARQLAKDAGYVF